MNLTFLLLSLALSSRADIRPAVDTARVSTPSLRPATPPRRVEKTPPKPASKPVGDPVLKRRRPPM